MDAGFDQVKTSDFDYPLPDSLIAQHPPVERDAGRMLVLDPVADRLEHATVRDLPRFLARADLLVLNDTRVLPARLRGVRAGGGEAEVLLLRSVQDGWWEALVRPGRKLKPGSTVQVGGSDRPGSVGPVHLAIREVQGDPLGQSRSCHQGRDLEGRQLQDFVPRVGPLPGRDGLWIAGGYSGHGNVMGFGCGELVARAILGRDEPLLRLFDPARFA